MTRSARSPIGLRAIGLLVAMAAIPGLEGCSAKTESWHAAGTAKRSDAKKPVGAPVHAEPPVVATASARPLETRSIRPIPEVISKPRLFEMPASMVAKLSPLEATSVEPIEFPSAEPPTVAEVREMMKNYVAALKRRDVASLVAHWSESGESVDLDSGRATRGRASIGQVFASLFEKEADADVRIDLATVRPIRDEVAVVDGVSTLRCAGNMPARSRFSAVVVKQGSRWLIESVRESAMPAADDAEPVKPLSNLRWLIGHWESVRRDGDPRGEAASTHCFWSGREAYLVRSHTVFAEAVPGEDEVADADGPGREITEIVGWDPVAKSMRSWIFSSDGGFGEGMWTIESDAVVIRVDGTLADGSPASGSLRITRRGADELSYEVSGEGVARLLPPAGDFLRTARVSKLP